ncbi:myc-associated zinc finger protein [Clupea harengus]|uniref:Myc-associated zinc finger protein n=1 Tax=Clupea harengus TaxID=7950 RepID=A0A6P8EKE2_CLUHA|nr:myc-associated zinc finger protein [Clupea harengus]
MDATWSNFLFQTPPSQAPTDGTIQSELLPELAGSAHSPPSEQEAPPSTVDTAALSEDPDTGLYQEKLKPAAVSRSSARASTHICSICSKTFKNGYNLRRHQSVHTGVRMKDRSARAQTTVPLSLLQLTLPPPPTPPSSQPAPPDLQRDAVTTATVTMVTAQPLSTAVVVAGTMVQVSQSALLPAPVPSASLVSCPSSSSSSSSSVRKNHACEACGKAFRDVYHLNRHRLSHSDEKPFSCPVCQQRFKRKDRMSYHVRSHQGGVEKPYVCPHCAKGFSRPDHLNSHVRQVHSTERPFKCPTCESAFATKDRLRAHLIRHEDKVPCHVCGKLLSPAYITDHMRVHNQSQHRICHLCNRSFTTLTYLRVHAQKHHGAEWKEGGGGRAAGGVLLCQLCGVHCKTPAQLQGHMGTHTAMPTDAPATPDNANITVTTGNNTVSLLVTDCSSITPQTHS